MRVLLAVLLFASLALADISYTGAWSTNSPLFRPPEYTGNGCAATGGSSNYTYQVFNTTFLTAGIREIQILSEAEPTLYIYRGSFTPLTPCNNLQTFEDNDYYFDDEDSSIYDDPLDVHQGLYFAADLYFFVIVIDGNGYNNNAEYTFGFKVLDANVTQTIVHNSDGSIDGTAFWDQPLYDSDGKVTVEGSNETITKYVFTAATTGLVDIYAWGYNNSYYSEIYLGIYNGSLSNAQVEVNYTGFFTYRHESGTYILGFPLIAGQQYTLVASNAEGYDCYVGFFIRPTNLVTSFNSGSAVTGVYTQPSEEDNTGHASDIYQCADDEETYSGCFYAVVTYSSVGTISLITTSSEDTYNEYAPIQYSAGEFSNYLYGGTNANPPSACPTTSTYQGWAYDGTLYDLDGFSTHTLVIAPYSASTSTAPAGSASLVYIFNGPTVGFTGPSATPAPSTPAPTTSTPTSAPTTSSPTSAPTTSSPTSAPTAPPTITYVITETATLSGNCSGLNATIYAAIAVAANEDGATFISQTCVNSTNNTAVVVIVFTAKLYTSDDVNDTATGINEEFTDYLTGANVKVVSSKTTVTAQGTTTTTGSPSSPTNGATTATTTAGGSGGSGTSDATRVAVSVASVLVALALVL